MFLTFDRVFPDGAREADIAAFYRPRPGVPFTPYRGADGRRHLVWTTFMPTQVDIDVHHPAGIAYLERLADTLAAGGVSTVRLDAIGYAVKTPGTDSFMTAHTLEFVAEAARIIRARGMRVLVEVHAHHSQQQAIAPLVDLVYDFATPPLILHSLGTGRVDRLAEWLAVRPAERRDGARHARRDRRHRRRAGRRAAGHPVRGRDGRRLRPRGRSRPDGPLRRRIRDAHVGEHAAPDQCDVLQRAGRGRRAGCCSLAPCRSSCRANRSSTTSGCSAGEDDRGALRRDRSGPRREPAPLRTGGAAQPRCDTPVARGQLALAALRRHPAFGGDSAGRHPTTRAWCWRGARATASAELRVRFDDPRYRGGHRRLACESALD